MGLAWVEEAHPSVVAELLSTSAGCEGSRLAGVGLGFLGGCRGVGAGCHATIVGGGAVGAGGRLHGPGPVVRGVRVQGRPTRDRQHTPRRSCTVNGLAMNHRRLVRSPTWATSASARMPLSASTRVTTTIQITCIESYRVLPPFTDAADSGEPADGWQLPHGPLVTGPWPAQRSRLHQLDMHPGQGPGAATARVVGGLLLLAVLVRLTGLGRRDSGRPRRGRRYGRRRRGL
jgi:hypothetical protein